MSLSLLSEHEDEEDAEEGITDNVESAGEGGDVAGETAPEEGLESKNINEDDDEGKSSDTGDNKIENQ